MEERFMLFKEMLKDEYEEGREEGRNEGLLLGKTQSIFQLLEELGPIPADVNAKIMSETDTAKLQVWLKLAAKAESMEEFLKAM